MLSPKFFSCVSLSSILILGEFDGCKGEVLGMAVEAAVTSGDLCISEVGNSTREPWVPRLAVIPIEAHISYTINEALRDLLHPLLIVEALKIRLIREGTQRLRLPACEIRSLRFCRHILHPPLSDHIVGRNRILIAFKLGKHSRKFRRTSIQYRLAIIQHEGHVPDNMRNLFGDFLHHELTDQSSSAVAHKHHLIEVVLFDELNDSLRVICERDVLDLIESTSMPRAVYSVGLTRGLSEKTRPLG